MSGRKITFVLIPIIFFVILHLNYNDNTIKYKDFASKNITEVNDTLLPQMSQPIDVQAINTGPNKNDGIGFFDCLSNITFDEEARMANITHYLQSLDNFFSESASLYYAMYAKPLEGETRLDLLFEYYEQFPSSPIVTMDLISQCAISSDERCTKNFIKDAINSDSNNGAMWFSAITFYATKGDDERVLDSVEGLEKTTFFNERFGEKALLYAQALEGSNSNNFNLNALAGVGKAASTFPLYSAITKWCQEGLDELARANACLNLGKQLETRSKTLTSNVIGIALQKNVFEYEGDTDSIQLIEKSRKELMKRPEETLFQKASIMLILDERLLRSWLNNIDFQGELESQRLLILEAEALYEGNENYICTLIYEMLGNF